MTPIRVRTVAGAETVERDDLVAIEEPLEIRIAFGEDDHRLERPISITMRTPGEDFDLACGFLFTEGILRTTAEIVEMRQYGPPSPPSGARNTVRVELSPGARVDLERLERHFYTTSSCGVCGKASIEALHAVSPAPLNRTGPVIDADLVHRLPALLRQSQRVFESTGGLHAAGLFDATGDLISLQEDVGRHNAVDKLIGAAFRADRLPLGDHVLMVSGRASFELAQKALMAGIPVLAAVGAPSSLAVELARENGMTILGFVRDDRFNVYSGEWRIAGLKDS